MNATTASTRMRARGSCRRVIATTSQAATHRATSSFPDELSVQPRGMPRPDAWLMPLNGKISPLVTSTVRNHQPTVAPKESTYRSAS